MNLTVKQKKYLKIVVVVIAVLILGGIVSSAVKASNLKKSYNEGIHNMSINYEVFLEDSKRIIDGDYVDREKYSREYFTLREHTHQWDYDFIEFAKLGMLPFDDIEMELIWSINDLILEMDSFYVKLMLADEGERFDSKTIAEYENIKVKLETIMVPIE